MTFQTSINNAETETPRDFGCHIIVFGANFVKGKDDEGFFRLFIFFYRLGDIAYKLPFRDLKKSMSTISVGYLVTKSRKVFFFIRCYQLIYYFLLLPFLS